MKILVTGGAGFIGSHLCEHVLKYGHEVICVDNLSTGQLKNIEHIKDKITFVQGDANSFDDLEPIFKNNKLGAVFDDIKGTRNILRLALQYGKPKIVFASSSEVYGEPVEIPEVEDGHTNAKLPYAVTKLYCEKLLEAYWQKYSLPTCSLRFFNVYGPRQESSDYGFVGGIFIKRVLQGLPPVIFGDGTQNRDFVFVDDNVETSIKVMES